MISGYFKVNFTVKSITPFLLPTKLDSLQRTVRRWRRQIPLLKLLWKTLTVVIEKQASLPQWYKDLERQGIKRQSWRYCYRPLDMIRTILSPQPSWFGIWKTTCLDSTNSSYFHIPRE